MQNQVANEQKILLETGTNEVEILEFFLAGQSFGINVAKVLQIVPFEAEDFTETPDTPGEMPGVLLWRGETIPLLDLAKTLGKKKAEQPERPIALVTSFNNVVNAFLIDGVNRIHRVAWTDIQPTSQFLERYSARVTGSIHIEKKDILLVDFEYIIAEMFPDTGMAYKLQDQRESAVGHRRGDMRITLAEDSSLIRNIISHNLKQAGYAGIDEFENGLDAHNHVFAIKQASMDDDVEVATRLNLIITDIEMPKLDGLTFCKRVKSDPVLQHIPVIIFSSLIDEQMADKCKEVGANGYITKPEITRLVGMLDELMGIEAEEEDQEPSPEEVIEL